MFFNISMINVSIIVSSPGGGEHLLPGTVARKCGWRTVSFDMMLRVWTSSKMSCVSFCRMYGLGIHRAGGGGKDREVSKLGPLETVCGRSMCYGIRVKSK